MDEELGIGISVAGSKEALQQLQPVINTIKQFSLEVSRLSRNLSSALSSLSNFSSQADKLSKRTISNKGILKSKNNRLNVGDLANLETGKVDKSFSTFDTWFEKSFAPDVPKQTAKELSSVSKNAKQANTSIKKLDNTTKNANKSSKDWVKTLWNFGKVVYIARRAASAINSLVEASGTWIENLNLFAVTFGDNYQETLDWALEFADRLGVANNEIVKMTGYFKQLSSAIGIADETSDTLSQTLTQLTYDFASFYNVGIESISEKLQSGIFSGQVRTLRSIGIDVSQESIDNLFKTNEALSQFNLSARQLSQSQKVIARVLITMNSGANAFGDMARSIDTLQNRVRVLQGSWQNLQLALGDTFSDFASSVVAYAIGIVQSITSIVRAIAPIKKEVDYDLGDNVFTQISEDAEDANTSIGNLSFDKFETLTSSEDENLTITEALTAELERQTELYNEISSQFDGIDEKVVEIKNNILKWIFPSKTLEQIQEMVKSLGKDATVWNKLKAIMAEANPIIQAVYNTILKLWEIFKKISPILTGIGSSLLNIVSTIINALDKLGLLETVLTILMGLKIYSKIVPYTKAISSIVSGLKTLYDTIKSKIIAVFSKMNQKLDESIDKMFDFGKTYEKVSTKTPATGKQIAGAFGSIATAIGATTLAVITLVNNWDTMSDTAKTLTYVVIGLTVAAAALAATYYAIKQNWAKAVSVAGMVVTAGATVAAGLSGFENGGIPKKSELFYMNENGVPEALINTGGSQTNVINIDQLSEGMRRGFVQAIYDTGLNKNGNVTLTLSGNVNDSAFARAIFPALKTESTRRGGNQL